MLNTFVEKCWHYKTAMGAHGGAVGWGTALQAGRSRVRFPIMSLEFFHWHNPSGRTMTLGLTYVASKKNEYQQYFLGDKGGR